MNKAFVITGVTWEEQGAEPATSVNLNELVPSISPESPPFKFLPSWEAKGSEPQGVTVGKDYYPYISTSKGNICQIWSGTEHELSLDIVNNNNGDCWGDFVKRGA